MIIDTLRNTLFAATFAMAPLWCAASEQEDVRNLIQTAYCNGAYNQLDTKTMRQGFVPEFAIFGAEGNTLERYGIDAWIAAIEKRKAAPDFKPESALRDCRITHLDIKAEVASARIEVKRGTQLLYTDFMLLIRFEQGWRIVAKVYHEEVQT